MRSCGTPEVILREHGFHHNVGFQVSDGVDGVQIENSDKKLRCYGMEDLFLFV